MRSLHADVLGSIANQVRNVAVPRILADELEAAKLPERSRLVILYVIYRYYMRRSRCQPINQRVLDAGISAHERKKIMHYIRNSKFIRAAANGSYREGERSIAYEVKDIPLSNAFTKRQHKKHRRRAGAGCAAEGVCPWGNCVDVVWVTVNFGVLLNCVLNAWKKLGYDKAVYDAEWSLSQVDETDSAVSKKLFDRGRSVRKDGRIYSPATNLPRSLRRRLVRFNGKAEYVDVSACYPWLLAAIHRRSRWRAGLDTTEVDRLMDLIESGQFYEALAKIAGLPYGSASDKDKIKGDFQKFCVFGPIGWHPLWRALQSICPGVCNDIRWWRSQQGGKTRLAHMLMRAEGALMTDGLIRYLVGCGVPAVQIHDGAIVPAGRALEAAAWLQELSRGRYGRSCRVKTERIA